MDAKPAPSETLCPSLLASDLRGIPVVDVDAAAPVGRVRELVLDTGAHRVAGVLVGPGRLGRAGTLTIPARAVGVVGADVLTVRRMGGRYEGDFGLAALPTCGALVGRRIVGWSGRQIGVVADVLIDRCSGAVDGYVLAAGPARPTLWRRPRGGPRRLDYVQAARARVGPQMVVAPDGAVVRGALVVGPAGQEPPPERAEGWGRAVQNCTVAPAGAL